jgi:hypothetical protein
MRLQRTAHGERRRAATTRQRRQYHRRHNEGEESAAGAHLLSQCVQLAALVLDALQLALAHVLALTQPPPGALTADHRLCAQRRGALLQHRVACAAAGRRSAAAAPQGSFSSCDNNGHWLDLDICHQPWEIPSQLRDRLRTKQAKQTGIARFELAREERLINLPKASIASSPFD